MATIAATMALTDLAAAASEPRDKTGARVSVVPRRDRQRELVVAKLFLAGSNTRKNRRRVARALRHADVASGAF